MPILGVIASGISGHLTPPWPENSFYQIANTTVGAGGSSTITFSSIPSTYTHLQVRIMARSSSTSSGNEDDIYMRFNNDSTNNYSGHQLYADGTTIGAGTLGGTPPVSLIYPAYVTNNNAIANTFGIAIIDILDYTNNNKYKVTRSMNGFDRNGAGFFLQRSGLWLSTSTISTITFSFSSASYMQYSSLALYGIKVS